MSTQQLVKVKGIHVLPALPPFLAFTQGDMYFVKPSNGNNGNDGRTPETAWKTLAYALSKCTANQNDIVFLLAESNTAGSTTDYQSALLDWNKDGVHLIGCNAGPRFSQRSRVAFASAYNTATDLFKLSANGCYIANIEAYGSVAGTNPTGCMTITGMRNHIDNCHIAGMGSTTDAANSYALQLSSAAENLFTDCVIGADTASLGTAQANSVILFTAGALSVRRNIFERCRIVTNAGHATNHVFLRAGATSMDRFNEFRDCTFINAIGTSLTYAFVVAASTSPAGKVLLTGHTGFIGADDWNNDSGNVVSTSAYSTSATYGVGAAVTKS